MKRIIALCLALFSTVALADSTWTEVHRGMPANVRGASGSFTSGTASAACPTSATAGIDLTGLGALTFEVETVTTSMPVGKKFIACVRNAATGNWLPVSDASLDWVTSASTLQAWSAAYVLVDYGRIAWEPDFGTTITGTIYVYGAEK